MSEVFAQIFARRYRAIALFEQEAGKPFDDLVSIRSEIVMAVRNLIKSHRQRSFQTVQEVWLKGEEKILTPENKTIPLTFILQQ